MKASLRLEAIGDDTVSMSRAMVDRAFPRSLASHRWDEVRRLVAIPQRQWCAEITGFDGRYGFARRFLQGQKDYSQANSVGSRGVYVYYTLESGHIYEVRAPQSWIRSRRYFCLVTASGEIEEIDEEEVRAWLDRQPPPISEHSE